MESYEDIINFPHFEPKYHPRMDAYSRAAQFAPFKALIGYEDDIKETSRLTDKKIEISEDKKKQMNENLFFLKENIKEKWIVTLTYFVPDSKKEGGIYQEYEGIIKAINETNHTLIFTSGKKIQFDDIYQIHLKKEGLETFES
jgi:yolD-like protein